MDTATIDKILYLQLAVARLGEKELMFWWNTDLVYKLGGADFLERLVGSTMAPIAAGEGILQAAARKDEQLLSAIPSKAWSLFNPEPALRSALVYRYRHFKTYPNEIPQSIKELLDPQRDWKSAELHSLIGQQQKPKTEATSFGLQLILEKGWGELDIATSLAACFSEIEKGKYIMPYYRLDNAS